MGLADVGATVAAEAVLARFLADPVVASALFRSTSECELAEYYAYAHRADNADPDVLDTLYGIARPRLAPAERQKVRRARICGVARAERA